MLENSIDQMPVRAVQPLRLNSNHSGDNVDAQGRPYSGSNREHSPPLSPHFSGPEDSSRSSKSSASSFVFAQKEAIVPPRFVRVLHDFIPLESDDSDESDEGSTCLKIERGMILVMHEQHDSGWADGTIISPIEHQVQRGWFPGNYCEPCIPNILVPLWHSVESMKVSQDASHVARIVGCVRSLLEGMDCLARDAPLVVENGLVRDERKSLLSELSAMVSASKQASSSECIAKRSRRVFARASRLIEPTAPYVDISCEYTPEADYQHSDMSRNASGSSYLPRSHLNMAGASLTRSHDILLSHLAAFIGKLHLQAPEAGYLFRATKHAALVATQLISAVDRICTRYPSHALSQSIQECKGCIRTLIELAKGFVGREEECVEESMARKLVECATEFVRLAGSCVDKARHLIEIQGDFDLDLDARIERANVRVDKELPPSPDKDDETQEDDDNTLVLKRTSHGRHHEKKDSRSRHESPPSPKTLRGPTLHMQDDTEAFTQQTTRNADGQITGSTLYSLVCIMTDPAGPAETSFVSTFFTTFRLFASSASLARNLVYRTQDPAVLAQGEQVSRPVRLRVFNAFKLWIEHHWDVRRDEHAIPIISDFADTELQQQLPTASKKIHELFEKLARGDQQLAPRSISIFDLKAGIDRPPPQVTKSQLLHLRTSTSSQRSSQPTVLDFDPVELARQITIKEAAIFCAISEEELLHSRRRSSAGNIKTMSALSTDLTSWIVSSILDDTEAKKRALTIKQWIKVADQCLMINNYDALMAILCALNSSTISRLKRTWDQLSAKSKATLEKLRACTDHSRNYATYRNRLRQAEPPCLPFVGLYLTDLTFVDEGILSWRPSSVSTEGSGGADPKPLINWAKWVKTAKIVEDLKKFQVLYPFEEVPELQAWLEAQIIRVRKNGRTNVGDLWRRSLIVEPKTAQSSTGSSSSSFVRSFGMQRRVSEQTTRTESSSHSNVTSDDGTSKMESLLNWASRIP